MPVAFSPTTKLPAKLSLSLRNPFSNLKVGLGRRKPALVGVDMGHRELRIVRMECKRGNYKIMAAASVATPSGSLENGLPVRPEQLAGALQTLAEKAGLAGARVVIAAPGKHLITRQLRLPMMPPEELAAAAVFEGGKALPVPEKDLVIAHLPIGEVEIDGQKQQEVMLLALPRAAAHRLYEVFDKAGLRLVAIDVEPSALYRVFTGNVLTGEGIIAVINLGATLTGLSIFREGRLCFTRSIAYGGDTATEAVAQAFDLDMEGARKLQEQDGEVIFGELDLSAGGNEKLQLESSIRSGLGEIVSEIRRSIDFFELQAQGARVDKLLLVGGLARLKGIEHFIEEEMVIPSSLGQPSFSLPPETLGVMARGGGLDPAYFLAMGLAMRGLK